MRGRAARWDLKAAFVWQLAVRTLVFTVKCATHTHTLENTVHVGELLGGIWHKYEAENRCKSASVRKTPSLQGEAMIWGHKAALFAFFIHKFRFQVFNTPCFLQHVNQTLSDSVQLELAVQVQSATQVWQATGKELQKPRCCTHEPVIIHIFTRNVETRKGLQV